MSETCSERERLLSKWTESSRRLARLGDEQLAQREGQNEMLGVSGP